MLYLHDAKAGSTASGKGFRVSPAASVAKPSRHWFTAFAVGYGRRSQAGGNLLTVRGRTHCTRLL